MAKMQLEINDKGMIAELLRRTPAKDEAAVVSVAIAVYYKLMDLSLRGEKIYLSKDSKQYRELVITTLKDL